MEIEVCAINQRDRALKRTRASQRTRVSQFQHAPADSHWSLERVRAADDQGARPIFGEGSETLQLIVVWKRQERRRRNWPKGAAAKVDIDDVVQDRRPREHL